MDLQKVAIWIIGVDGKTVYANAKMGEILVRGSGRDDRAVDVFTYIFPEDLEAAKRLFQSKETDTASNLRLCRRDGAAVLVNFHGTAMHDASGRFTGTIGMCTGAEQP